MKRFRQLPEERRNPTYLKRVGFPRPAKRLRDLINPTYKYATNLRFSHMGVDNLGEVGPAKADLVDQGAADLDFFPADITSPQGLVEILGWILLEHPDQHRGIPMVYKPEGDIQ